MKRLVWVLALLVGLGCDGRKDTEAALQAQVTTLADRCQALEARVQELEDELDEAKRTCEGHACDCP